MAGSSIEKDIEKILRMRTGFHQSIDIGLIVIEIEGGTDGGLLL
jgi:hypothetical protein